jgi:PERQ amino acid-rich with GYF domain-containing protein
MTVPLVSLITNPPSTTNQNSATPAPKAWATVPVKEEGKSLKEIQEAEERRARESQKPKNTTIVSMASSTGGAKDDEVATLTWGLPTSLVGTRGAASKDSTSPITNSAPVVWANAAKVVAGTGPKKALTMKDIQEEEERRKQREKELATTARRVGEKVITIPMTLKGH